MGTNYGFSIPPGATIDGIKVELYGIESPGGPHPNSKVLKVRIVKGGVIGGSDLGDNWVIDVGPSNRNYGGATELWGLSWTSADINASNFGAALQVSVDKHDDNDLNSMRITVYYT